MIAVCLITLRPSKIWCEFLNNFKSYKIFIIIDDNNFDCSEFISTYKNITFVQIENNKCEESGYLDTNFMIGKFISGWDKALYYFGVVHINSDYVWFIEDDVYFNSEDTLIQIDKQYSSEDLISNIFDKNETGEKLHWHWEKINIKFNPPYYNGMMCAVRFSRKLIECIDEYAKSHNILFFLEALFPTIAKKNNLVCVTPIELEFIHYRTIFDLSSINKDKLYHPMKDINTHVLLRQSNNK